MKTTTRYTFFLSGLILVLPLVGHFDVRVDGISQSTQLDRFPSGFLEILLFVGQDFRLPLLLQLVVIRRGGVLWVVRGSVFHGKLLDDIADDGGEGE